MKTITTIHKKVGFNEQVKIIETALREQFGIDDNSAVMSALATTIWLRLAWTPKDDHTWGTAEILESIQLINSRLTTISAHIARS